MTATSVEVGEEECDRRLSTTVEIGLVLLLIYLSGNIFFIDIHYSIAVLGTTFVFAFAFILQLLRHSLTVPSGIVLLLLVFAGSIIITLLLNGEANVGSHGAVFLQLLTAAMAAQLLSPQRFVLIASLCLGVMAWVSLGFFTAALVSPEVVLMFPRTPALVSVDYYNALVHVYLVPTGYDDLVILERNSGIFWEPGAYQAFLNVGLFWLLGPKVTGRIRPGRQAVLAAGLGAAIITTFSAMGYLLMVIVLISRRKAVCELIRRWPLLALLPAGAFVAVLSAAGGFGRLFQRYLGDANAVRSRLSLDRVDLVPNGVPELLFGSSFTSTLAMDGAVWNSVLQTVASLGLVFTGVLLASYWAGSRRMGADGGFVLFMLIVLSASTESLFWRPFFMVVAFAGARRMGCIPSRATQGRRLVLRRDVAT